MAMDDLLHDVLYIVIILAALMLLTGTIIIPFFNMAYASTVTGLSSATLQGIMLFVFFIFYVAIILGILKAVRKK
jgi:hypothetical protein